MLHFISTPYNSFISADTVTAIKVVGERVIIKSNVEHDFIYAKCADGDEAMRLADTLLEELGIVLHH
jgi:hypothetical protein